MLLFRGVVTPGTILVTDDGNHRVQIVDHEGRHLESIQVDGGGDVVGLFSDGSWLVKVIIEPRSREPGPMAYEIQYWRHDTGGHPIGMITTAVSASRFINRAGRISDYVIPFTPDPAVTAVGDHLWLDPRSESYVDGYGFDGDVLVRHSWGFLQRSSAKARARFESALPRIPVPDRQVLRSLQLPEFLPTHQRLIADTDGNLWLERFRLFRWEETNDPVWDVIDPQRGWLGAVETPRDTRILDISSSAVIGLTRDDEGSGQIRAFRIHKHVTEGPGLL
jgi:hypothetical protein